MASLSSKKPCDLKYDYCEYCYGDFGKCSCTEKVKRLKRFFGRVKNKVFVKNGEGEFYRCVYSGDGPWSCGPSCGRMITKEIVYLTEGYAIDSNDGTFRSFCKDHVPKCYLDYYDCNFYRCDDCYHEKCNYCSKGTCKCPDIL